MGKEEGEKLGEDELKGKEKGKGVCSSLKKYFHQDPQDDKEAEWSKKDHYKSYILSNKIRSNSTVRLSKMDTSRSAVMF